MMRLVNVEFQNFIVCIFDAQFQHKLGQDGSLTYMGVLDEKLNKIFTAVFFVELIINAYANWLRRFVSNGWSKFLPFEYDAVICH